jgi:hypothetical protein
MRTEVVEKLSDLLTAAFGLVAALAWNGAIQAIFADVFGESSTIGPMLAYAVLVTVIAVAAAIWIGRVSERGGVSAGE